jgi:hypothetical protein
MTRAPQRNLTRPAAFLARLFVVLALALFGVPQSHAGGSMASPGPAAQSLAGQGKAVLTAQPHLLRALIPHDDTADTVAAGADLRVLQCEPAGTVSRAPHQSLIPFALGILPPVRGPPVG